MQRIAYGAGLRLVLGGLLVSATGCGLPSGKDESDLSVIYGSDNRKDVYESNDAQMRTLALSTAALVKKNAVQINTATGVASLAAATFGSSQHLCATEKFFSQPNPAFCSGFLVAPDILVTAGHCVTNQSSCVDTSFVFGMGYFHAADNPTRVPASDVYNCAELIHAQSPSDGADFAVVRLDRPVTGRAPLAFRRDGQAAVGDPLTVIGNPSGLPTKISDGAHVRSISGNEFLVADTDTYGGNSGSSVFHSTTGLIEGILVRGEQDFTLNGECYTSHVCAQDACRGEDITLASAFAPYISQADNGGSNPQNPDVNEAQVYEQNMALTIPDNNRNGVQQNIPVSQQGLVTALKLDLKITHTYIGDLVISLVNPSGVEVVLHNRAGGNTDDINSSYEQVLAPLKNKPATGTWVLKVSDRAAIDKGQLTYLKLSVTTSHAP